MVAPFISINLGKFRTSLEGVRRRLQVTGERAILALRQALFEVANDMIAEAQQKAPVGEGRLRESATVEEPVLEGTLISVVAGFNVVYARIRDQGGIIRPVRAKALFIPLKRGVRPGQPGLVLGEDFQLVPGPMTRKDHVEQKGTGYLTTTVAARVPTLADVIGQRVIAIMGRAA